MTKSENLIQLVLARSKTASYSNVVSWGNVSFFKRM